MSCANIPIPKSESDITPSWIQSVVGVNPVSNSVTVTGNIQDGVGFLSNLCRVSFKTEENGQTQNILVKLLPVSPEYKALTLSENFDQREIQFYEITLAKILDVVPKLEENLCKYFCGKSGGKNEEDYGSMLVMEDLKPRGYEMLNPESNKWADNLEKVVQFLAEFHAAGKLLEKKSRKSIAELFPFCMGLDSWNPATLLAFGHESIPKFKVFLEKNGVSPEVKAAYEYLTAEMDNVFAASLKETSRYRCLIHGDVWPPNIMVVEQPGGGGDSKAPVKIIDWQLLGYRDPVAELSVAVIACLPLKELKRENVNKFCGIYWNTFGKAMEDCKEGVRGREEFQREFDTWGIVYAYIWFLLSLDSFPEDQEKLLHIFLLLEEEYRVSEFMRKYFENNKK